MKKKNFVSILLLVIFTLFSFNITNAATGVVDQGDQASVTETGTGTDDLQNEDGTTTEENTESGTTEEKPVELAPVTFEKVNDKNAYTFDFNIADATKSFATEFEEVRDSMVLSKLEVKGKEGEEISDDLKNSLSVIIIKDKENPENNLILGLDEIEGDGITLEKGNKMYVLYDPEGNDNSTEVETLKNMLVFSGEELPLPLQFGVAETDDDLNVTISEPSESYEEIVKEKETQPEEDNNKIEDAVKETLNPETNTSTGETTATGETQKVKAAEVNTDKEELVKKDTGPVENFTYLFMLLLALFSGITYIRKK